MLDEPLDLSFKPIENAHPAHLSARDIDSYNHSGFARPFDIFDGIVLGGLDVQNPQLVLGF